MLSFKAYARDYVGSKLSPEVTQSAGLPAATLNALIGCALIQRGSDLLDACHAELSAQPSRKFYFLN